MPALVAPSVTSSTPTTMTLQWTPPATTGSLTCQGAEYIKNADLSSVTEKCRTSPVPGGSAVTGYSVYQFKSGSGSGSYVLAAGATSTITSAVTKVGYTVTWLTANTAYTFKVGATNGGHT